MSAAQQINGIAAGVDASGGLLAELEAQIRAPDSILEPSVLDLLKDYLRAGGKPQSAIEDLSEAYTGMLSHLLYAQSLLEQHVGYVFPICMYS